MKTDSRYLAQVMHRLPKGIINKGGFVFYLAFPVCVGVFAVDGAYLD